MDHPDHPALDLPLSTWLSVTDRQLPQRLLPLTLRHVLQQSLSQLTGMPGIGRTRFAKVVELIGRAHAEVLASRPNAPSSPLSAPEPPPPLAQTDTHYPSEQTWAEWCAVLLRHRLESYPLGRFADALTGLSGGLWEVPLRTYTEKTLADIEQISGHGPWKIRSMLKVVMPLATALAPIPKIPHLSLVVLPTAIHAVQTWVEGVLREKQMPKPSALTEHLLQPLLSQLEKDVGPEVFRVIWRRLGVSEASRTLRAIGADLALSKERVRQLAAKAQDVFRLRWPEGKYLLKSLYELLRSTPEMRPQLGVLQGILEVFYPVTVAQGASCVEVLEAWDRAGRQKLTPMTEEQMTGWLAANVPLLHPEMAIKWLSEEGLALRREAAPTLYFSHDPLDLLLCHLHLGGEPLTMTEVAAFLKSDERLVRERLDRDPRFIEDEFRRVQPSQHCSFFRRDGNWHLKLETASEGGTRQHIASLAVTSLVHLILGGLTKVGVADATDLGVHRYANEVLAVLYAAALPSNVTPYLLASMLVRHSDGLIRPMRRLRLRWDCAAGSLPVRGKRGWVGHLVREAGVPMTLVELDTCLRGYYQDHDWRGFSRLDFDEDEEGENYWGVKIIPGNSHMVPSIILPLTWELDLARQNVSEGVKQFISRVVSASAKAGFARHHLNRLLWAVSLAEHLACGGMKWLDGGEGSRG